MPTISVLASNQSGDFRGHGEKCHYVCQYAAKWDGSGVGGTKATFLTQVLVGVHLNLTEFEPACQESYTVWQRSWVRIGASMTIPFARSELVGHAPSDLSGVVLPDRELTAIGR
jgi:hypothetical protein